MSSALRRAAAAACVLALALAGCGGAGDGDSFAKHLCAPAGERTAAGDDVATAEVPGCLPRVGSLFAPGVGINRLRSSSNRIDATSATRVAALLEGGVTIAVGFHTP